MGKEIFIMNSYELSALEGKEFIFRAYKEAIEKQYKFYSYGDCMLLK